MKLYRVHNIPEYNFLPAFVEVLFAENEEQAEIIYKEYAKRFCDGYSDDGDRIRIDEIKIAPGVLRNYSIYYIPDIDDW